MSPAPIATSTSPAVGGRAGMLPQSLLRRLAWRARHATRAQLGGDYRSTFRGRGMAFDQVVRYEWGDDPRDIDWNVTARLGEPYRKKFIEERELLVLLVFEDAPALQSGSTGRTRRETLIETAVLMMMIGAMNRDRVGLLYVSPSGHWYQPPGGRRAVMRTSARLLAQAPPPLDGPAGCPSPWRFVRRAASRGSVVPWLGPFTPATERPEAWRDLQQRYQLVGLRADDPWDEALPARTHVTAYDPIAAQLTTLDTGSLLERRAHARWRERREGWFADLFPRVEDRLPVPCGGDPLAVLGRYFRARAAR